MPKPEIPTVRKGLKDIAAAIGISVAQLSIVMKKDSDIPIYYIGDTPFMDTEKFRQKKLGVQPTPQFPMEQLEEAMYRASKRILREKFGEG